MKWIRDYQLFLFDFDGLLVNTELLHFKAYQQMCRDRGFELKWNWADYAKRAHFNPTAVRDAIYATFPKLKQMEPDWDVLYLEKRQAYSALIDAGELELMPGVKPLLLALEKAKIKRCVVTHSPEMHVRSICDKLPILDTIPYWVTREHYAEPKPHPECYLKAVEWHGKPGDQIIGFEDTPRGLKALLQAKIKGILVSDIHNPKDVEAFCGKSFSYVPSFEKLAG